VFLPYLLHHCSTQWDGIFSILTPFSYQDKSPFASPSCDPKQLLLSQPIFCLPQIKIQSCHYKRVRSSLFFCFITIASFSVNLILVHLWSFFWFWYEGLLLLPHDASFFPTVSSSSCLFLAPIVLVPFSVPKLVDQNHNHSNRLSRAFKKVHHAAFGWASFLVTHQLKHHFSDFNANNFSWNKILLAYSGTGSMALKYCSTWIDHQIQYASSPPNSGTIKIGYPQL